METRTDTHRATYEERQSVENVAENIFESWAAENKMDCHRMGFDEKKKPVKNFYCLGEAVRGWFDYCFSKPGDDNNIYLAQIKGSGALKVRDYNLYCAYEDNLCGPRSHLVVGFFAKGWPNIILPMISIREVWDSIPEKTWASDGKKYKWLDTKALTKIRSYDYNGY